MSAEGQEAAQEARHLSFRVVQPGVCNAVVFWHELSLPGAGGSSGGLGDGSRAAGGSGADVNSGVGDGIGAGGGSGAGCGSRAGGSSGADGNSGAAATPLGGGSGANDGSRDAGDDVTRSQQCSNIGGAAQRSAQSAHPSGVAQDGLSWSPFQAPLPGQAKREQVIPLSRVPCTLPTAYHLYLTHHLVTRLSKLSKVAAVEPLCLPGGTFLLSSQTKLPCSK